MRVGTLLFFMSLIQISYTEASEIVIQENPFINGNSVSEGNSTSSTDFVPKKVENLINVVPVGKLNVSVISNKASAFGLIGALTELAVTQDESSRQGKKLSSYLASSEIDPRLLLSKSISDELGKCAIAVNLYQGIIRSDMEYKPWHEIKNFDFSQFESLISGKYIVEVYLRGLTVIKGNFYDTVTVFGEVKLYQGDSGSYIDYFNTSSTSYINGHIPVVFETSSDLILRSPMENAINNVSKNLSKKLCSKKFR